MFHRLLLFISLLLSSLLLFAQPGPSIEYFDKAEAFRQNTQRDSAAHYYTLAGDSFIASGNNQKAAEAYNQAGAMLNRLDDYEGAEKILQKAYALGHCGAADSLTFATTNVNLGVTYNAMENYQRSIEHHSKALIIRLSIYDSLHADVATSYGNMGNVFLNMKFYYDAVYCHERAMQIREQLYGRNSLEIIQSYTGLGNAYRELGKHDLAIGYFTKALSNKILQKGEGHVDLIPYYDRLIEAYRHSGDNEKEIYYERVVADIRAKTK